MIFEDRRTTSRKNFRFKKSIGFLDLIFFVDSESEKTRDEQSASQH